MEKHMAAQSGKLLKIPPWKCKPYAITQNSGPLFGLDTLARYIEDFTYTGTQDFTADDTQRLLRVERGTPIIGNLSASSELLGLGDCNLDEFNTITRGSRKHETSPDPRYIELGRPRYTVWESNKYFGKPGYLVKPPKVVLISIMTPFRDINLIGVSDIADTDGISLSNRLDQHYDYFADKELQVILDYGQNSIYNTLSYGCPVLQHNRPFAPSGVFKDFVGGELLVIVIHPTDSTNLLVSAPLQRDRNGVVAYEHDFSAYYRQYNLTSTDGVPDALNPDLIPYYTVFGDSETDVSIWNSVADKYSRRRYVSHFQLLEESPIPFATYTDFITATAEIEFTLGTLGHGYGDGDAYFRAVKPPDWEVGATYFAGLSGPLSAHQTVPRNTFSYENLTQIIMNDITEFYGS